MSKNSIDELVLDERSRAWDLKKDLWFVDFPEDKTPGNEYPTKDLKIKLQKFLGKLKIEEECSSGSWFGLSPKCYYLGNDEENKIGIKGVPKNCGMTRQDFEDALYNADCTIQRNFSRLQFHKKLGRMATINLTKKSLNAAYAKLFVRNNLVECCAWDELKK